MAYITIERADSLISAEGGPTEWSSLQNTDKQKILERATRRLETIPFADDSLYQRPRWTNGIKTGSDPSESIPYALEISTSLLSVHYALNPLSEYRDVPGISEGLSNPIADLPISVQTAIWPYLSVEMKAEINPVTAEKKFQERPKARAISYTDSDNDTTASGGGANPGAGNNPGSGTDTTLTEQQVFDYVNTFLVAGNQVTLTRDSTTKRITITSTATGGGGGGQTLTEEQVYDYVATFLVQSTDVVLSKDDDTNRITFTLGSDTIPTWETLSGKPTDILEKKDFQPKSTDFWLYAVSDHLDWSDPGGKLAFYSGTPSASTILNPLDSDHNTSLASTTKIRISKTSYNEAAVFGASQQSTPQPSQGSTLYFHADVPYIGSRYLACTITSVSSSPTNWYLLTVTTTQHGGNFYAGANNYVRITDEVPGDFTIPGNQVIVDNSFMARLKNLSTYNTVTAAALTAFLGTSSDERAILLTTLLNATGSNGTTTQAPDGSLARVGNELRKWPIHDMRAHILGPTTQALSVGDYDVVNTFPSTAGKVRIHPEVSKVRQINITWNTAQQRQHLKTFLVYGMRIKIGTLTGSVTPAGATENVIAYGGFQFNISNISGTVPTGNVDISILGNVLHWTDPGVRFLPAGTFGDILYHNGTDWTPLNKGTDGQFLT